MRIEEYGRKIVAVILVFFIFTINISFPDSSPELNYYQNGIDFFKKKNFEASLWNFNSCLEMLNSSKPVLKAKIYLFISACYDKMEDKKMAEYTLRLLKAHMDDEEIEAIPFIEQVSPFSLPGYDKIFKGTGLRIKNLIEKPKTGFKKKKSPLLWIIGGIAAAAVVVIALVLLKKKKKKANEELYKDIEWVYVPTGDFWMGDDKNIGSSDERPVHKVKLDGYYISKYEITFEQYDRFCDDSRRARPSASISNVYKVPRGKYPVFNITWEDADEYCKWLTRKSNSYIHLPTEAQWEKAARGNDQRTYPWGNQDPSRSLCNAGAPSNNAVPVVVGSYPSGVSPYGAYDMAGNVAEFCSDWYGSDYYTWTPYINPPGPSSGSSRVRRGGSFLFSDGSVRSSDRGGFLMVKKGASIGFRPVKEEKGNILGEKSK